METAVLATIVGLLDFTTNNGSDSVSNWEKATAVGTVGAVALSLIVLFGRSFSRWRKRPKLRLLGIDVSTRPPPGDRPSNRVTISVENSGRGRSAEDVEVFAGVFDEEVSYLGNMALGWTAIGAEPQHIPPGVSREVDLITIHENDDVVNVEYGVKPKDARHVLGEGEYLFVLLLTARDMNAKAYSTELEFDGVWAEGSAQWEHIQFTPLERTSLPGSARFTIWELQMRASKAWQRIRASKLSPDSQ